MIEETNVQINRSDTTISNETNIADNEAPNFPNIVRLSKTRGNEDNSNSLSKYEARKSLSLRSLNKKTPNPYHLFEEQATANSLDFFTFPQPKTHL